MKVAVTATGPDLDHEVYPRFGRAKYFLLVDTETMQWRAIQNSTSLELAQGAGIQAAHTVLKECPDVVLTGNCGPKAFKVLEARGVKVALGAKGTVRQALKDFLDGKYETASGPNVPGHWG